MRKVEKMHLRQLKVNGITKLYFYMWTWEERKSKTGISRHRHHVPINMHRCEISFSFFSLVAPDRCKRTCKMWYILMDVCKCICRHWSRVRLTMTFSDDNYMHSLWWNVCIWMTKEIQPLNFTFLDSMPKQFYIWVKANLNFRSNLLFWSWNYLSW